TIISPQGSEKFVAGISTITINYTLTDNFDPAPKHIAYLTDLEEGTTIAVTSGQVINPLDIDDGFWTLTVEAKDFLDNFSSSTTAKFEVIHDILPPRTTLQISEPKYATEISTYITNFTSFSLTAIDDLLTVGDSKGSGVSSISYWLEGKSTITIINSTPEVGKTFAIDFTLLDQPEGEYIIYYFAEDLYGHREETKSVTVIIDTTAPKSELRVDGIEFIDEQDRKFIRSDTNLVLSAEDPPVNLLASGVKEILYSIDYSTFTVYYKPITGLPEGKHTISYYSLDQLNNTEIINSLTLYVDTTAPLTTITVVPVPSNGNITSKTQFTLSAVDGGIIPCGVKYTEYRINSQEWIKYVSPFNIVGPDGTYNIYYRSADNLLNIEQPKLITVKLDNTPPNPPVIISPEDGITISDSRPIILGHAEPGSTVMIYDDINVLGKAITNPLGNFEFIPKKDLLDGVHKLCATATDIVGNISDFSTIVTITKVTFFADARITKFELIPVNPIVGQTAQIIVEVLNEGNSNIDTIAVDLYDNEKFVGSQNISLPAGQKKTLSFAWNVESIGLHILEVKADPQNLVPEKDETNNEYSYTAFIGVTVPIENVVNVFAEFCSPGVVERVYTGEPVIVVGTATYHPNISSEKPLMKGAEAKLFIKDTTIQLGETTYTNKDGNFRIKFRAPEQAGEYQLVAIVTNGTVTGEFDKLFLGVEELIVIATPEFVVDLSLSAVPVEGVPFQVQANVRNLSATPG
ncbi:MAG: Ig-like domain-containing protein, partial [Elusimicrobiota bacterium]|nr:Ig-like domain-containing protein [Elusimicrobiota bacterium]